MRALHFNKGCYLGQEIVERIRSRGNVHRHLRQLELSGPIAGAGTELKLDDGSSAGEVRSAAALRLPLGEDACLRSAWFGRGGSAGTGVSVRRRRGSRHRRAFWPDRGIELKQLDHFATEWKTRDDERYTEIYRDRPPQVSRRKKKSNRARRTA